VPFLDFSFGWRRASSEPRKARETFDSYVERS
jgi:hypothetical protein